MTLLECYPTLAPVQGDTASSMLPRWRHSSGAFASATSKLVCAPAISASPLARGSQSPADRRRCRAALRADAACPRCAARRRLYAGPSAHLGNTVIDALLLDHAPGGHRARPPAARHLDAKFSWLDPEASGLCWSPATAARALAPALPRIAKAARHRAPARCSK